MFGLLAGHSAHIGLIVLSGTSLLSQVSVKIIMLQSIVHLWMVITAALLHIIHFVRQRSDTGEEKA